MRLAALALALGACASSAATLRGETAPGALFATVTYRGASFSSDGARLLVSSNARGVFNLVSFDVKSGDATPLTDQTEANLFAVSYFPKDDRVLYGADRAGDEQTHLFVRELDGKTRDLTPGDKTRAGFVRWSGDLDSFYFISNERDPQANDLYGYRISDGQRTLVLENHGGWSIGALSDDGRWVALGKAHSNADADVLVWDARHPEDPPRLVTPHVGKVVQTALSFLPGSATLVYATDGLGEYAQAWAVDVETGERHLFDARPDGDVTGLEISRGGHYAVEHWNGNQRDQVRLVDLRKNAEVPLSLEVTPAAFQLSPDETRMAWLANGDASPDDVWVRVVGDSVGQQLTHALARSDLTDGQDVKFPSFDGLSIPGILYMRSGVEKAPAIVFVHGGPGGESVHAWAPLLQTLVAHGYVVLAVNNRGSSGFGKTFQHLDDRRHGDVDLADCVAAFKYLAAQSFIDHRRVAIMGQSYGGYLTAAALAFAPEVFAAGIDVYGPTNWVRTLDNIPAWWGEFRNDLFAEMGDPSVPADRAALEAASPALHADRIVKPLLVFQGANDPRVPKADSDQLVAAVKARGLPVEYVVFDGEGHGIQKRDDQIVVAEKTLDFLARYLRR